MASKWLLHIGFCLIVSEAYASFRILHKHFRKSPAQYEYETLYFTQQVDHFSFTSSQTYQQRYLVSKKWWQNGRPIFFYTGNEGAIDWFANNTGFMWDIAPEFAAMLVFAEHRYYGTSMPFGKDSFKDAAHVGYLTSEQALADFAKLILDLKASTPGAQDSPVIAFGGSYGGMLAAWFRMKYPAIVTGALAASAPIWWFGDLTPCGAYFKKVTDDFVRESKTCAMNIRASWDVINKYAATASGLKQLQKTLKLCSPLTQTDVPVLKNWLTETWGNLAMVDYPYPASFLEPLPAWPIRAVCEHLSRPSLQGTDLLAALTQGLGVYYNSTGSARCYNISVQDSGDMGDMGWNYQACTEMVMPMCSDGVNDMFEPTVWNLTQYIAGCMATYNLLPRPSWVQTQYGGKHIEAASNIVFSNGRLDPWSGGGVLDSISDTLFALVIDDGAHHLDLRSTNPSDPDSVLVARLIERTFIANWARSKPMPMDMSVVQPGDVWIEPFSLQDEWQMRLMMGLGILLGISLLLLLLRANTHRRANQKHKTVCDDHMKKPLL